MTIALEVGAILLIIYRCSTVACLVCFHVIRCQFRAIVFPGEFDNLQSPTAMVMETGLQVQFVYPVEYVGSNVFIIFCPVGSLDSCKI